MKLLLASANRGKLVEMRAILSDLAIEVICLDQLPDRPNVEETGATFLENARLKACAYAAFTGLTAIADDSGICVTALGDRPGVYSARFAGPGATDTENNTKLLAEMNGVADRRARFVCVTVCARPNGEYVAAEGSCAGELLNAQRGTDGFGYDPLFYVPEHGLTFAEMPPELKNRISHRARSLAALRRLLPEFLAGGK